MGCCESAEAADRKKSGASPGGRYMIAPADDADGGGAAVPTSPASPRGTGAGTSARPRVPPLKPSRKNNSAEFSDAEGDEGFDDLRNTGSGNLDQLQSARREDTSTARNRKGVAVLKRANNRGLGAQLLGAAQHHQHNSSGYLSTVFWSFLPLEDVLIGRTLSFDSACGVGTAVMQLSEQIIKYSFLFGGRGQQPADLRTLLALPFACSTSTPKPASKNQIDAKKKIGGPEAVHEFSSGGQVTSSSSTGGDTEGERADSRVLVPSTEIEFTAQQVAHNLRWGATGSEDIVVYVDPFIGSELQQRREESLAQLESFVFCPGKCICLDRDLIILGSRSFHSLASASSMAAASGSSASARTRGADARKVILRFPGDSPLGAGVGYRFPLKTQVTVQTGRCVGTRNLERATIGSSFFRQSLLKTLDLRSATFMQTITSIGDFCLAGCPNLTSVDLGASASMQEELGEEGDPTVPKLTKIGRSFLQGAKGLKKLDLSGWVGLESIEEDFLAGCYSLKELSLPKLANGGLEGISAGFLRDCNSLKEVDLAYWFNKATSIGDYVCYQCSELNLPRDNASLWQCLRVETIGEDFCRGCHGLTSLSFELGAFASLLEIGAGFLSECNNLVELRFSSLGSLRKIGDDFCYGCKSLESIYISGAPQLEIIGQKFVAHCPNLIDVSWGQSLNSCVEIGNGAFFNCPVLSNPSLEKLTALKSIGHGFCCSCLSLTVVPIPMQWGSSIESVGSEAFRGCPSLSGFSVQQPSSGSEGDGEARTAAAEAQSATRQFPFGTGLQTMGNLFLAECSQIVHLNLDLAQFGGEEGGSNKKSSSSLRKIPDWFCYGCQGLQTISFRGPLEGSILSIGANFAQGCSHLSKVDFGNMSRITAIGDSFLKDCPQLEELEGLKSMGNLRTIGSRFLEGCSNLKSINSKGFRSLTSVGPFFMSQCTSLLAFDLTTGLTNLNSVGDFFLSGCTGLIEIDRSRLHMIRHVGEGALDGCSSLPDQ